MKIAVNTESLRSARQAGWDMTCKGNFVTLSNDYGDYIEVTYLEGNYHFNNFGTSVTFLDLPQSVLNLIDLWMGVK